MAMGIVDDDVFARELELLTSKEEEKHEVKILQINRGRGNTAERSELVRATIAQSALEHGNTETARAFGASPAAVSAYKNDATSTASYHRPDEALAKRNQGVRNNIIDKATKKIALALKNISPDKIENAKLRDISALAKDMSSVVKNLSPSNPTGDINNVNFIVYTPRVRAESEFEVVDVAAQDE